LPASNKGIGFWSLAKSSGASRPPLMEFLVLGRISSAWGDLQPGLAVMMGID
jgi:hypothetical protein